MNAIVNGKEVEGYTILEAKELLELYMDQDIPAFLWGPPGVGKSDIIRQIANERGINLIDFRASLRDPVDLRGLPDLDKKAGVTKWLPPDELPRVDRDGKQGILLLDELNAAGPMMQVACYSLVLDREIGDYKLPPGWWPVAAGNRLSDRAAAQRMSKALSNRFAHITVFADAKAWLTGYGETHGHPIICAFIYMRPEFIYMMDPNSDEHAFSTPRSIAKACRVVDTKPHLRMKALEGVCGKAFATECEGFIEVYNELPDLDDIFEKPDKVKVPENLSAKYMLTLALAQHSNRDNYGNAMKFAKKLGRDFEVTFGTVSTKRDKALTKTKAYVEYIKRNKDINIGGFNN